MWACTRRLRWRDTPAANRAAGVLRERSARMAVELCAFGPAAGQAAPATGPARCEGGAATCVGAVPGGVCQFFSIAGAYLSAGERAIVAARSIELIRAAVVCRAHRANLLQQVQPAWQADRVSLGVSYAGG